jgi:phosphopantothenate-cysteine ligase
MNVFITAGGTSEPIDNVRSITNTGTGRLGSIIADTFAKEQRVDCIYYICAYNAVRPFSERVKVIPVQSTDDLQNEATKFLQNKKTDVIVHSMAVSDYKTKSVLTAGALAEVLKHELHSDTVITEEWTEKILERASLPDCNCKLSSQMKSPLIHLEQTPKILPKLRQLAPQAILVGFKLLNQVSNEVLLNTARELLLKNSCDFVLANDSSQIHGDLHTAYLIDKDKTIGTYQTKEEIAVGIVEAVLSKGVYDRK